MVVLESGEENLQVERLAIRELGGRKVSQVAREASEKTMTKYKGGHEDVEDDETNTFVIKVTKVMIPEDVAKTALNYLEV